ncbi:MAG: hypothetical protein JWR51_4748 [Devosia sp.]|uniref:DUF4159 domain-containing protein n=1 Tax=Devosia sp. TaxID=1871048 RepID=UPI00262A92AF|nr:DUF4159 domain-containing protein [Devosia sp.]MDB5531645.1 hypothetical protein [Devosia sp.]
MDFKKTTAGLLLASFAGLSVSQTAPTAAPAANPPTLSAAARVNAAKYAAHPHLAFIRTGNAAVDDASLRGITALKEKLNDLTTLNAEIVAVDIERDDISLFPMIYWPINPNSPALSNGAQRKVQKYLQMAPAHLIIFDINNSGKGLGNKESLNRVLGNVTLRRLDKVGEGHPLTKTFFKLNHLRGTFDYNANVLVEESGPVGSEIVSSVIIGENNWAAAWAGMTLAKGSPEQDQSLRAGVNFAMLALTGNYKADQALILAKPKEPEKK